MTDIFWKGTEKECVEFFWRMTDQEAKAFLDLYVALRDERLVLLKQRFQETGSGMAEELDFSPKSLLPLWQWALKHFHKREHTDSELEHIMLLPDWFRQHQLATKPLSEDTLILLNDISYYFAEVFIRNHPGVRWTVCKTKVKRHADGNQPVLSGFSVSMNPRSLVKVAALKTLDGKAGEDELRKLYDVWLGNLRRPSP